MIVLIAVTITAYLASRPAIRPSELIGVQLRVQELDCEFWCPIQVDRTLGTAPGVWDLRVDTRAGTVTAQIDPHATSGERLREALAAVGFTVSKVTEFD